MRGTQTLTVALARNMLLSGCDSSCCSFGERNKVLRKLDILVFNIELLVCLADFQVELSKQAGKLVRDQLGWPRHAPDPRRGHQSYAKTDSVYSRYNRFAWLSSAYRINFHIPWPILKQQTTRRPPVHSAPAPPFHPWEGRLSPWPPQIGAIYLLVCFNFRSLPRRKKCKLWRRIPQTIRLLLLPILILIRMRIRIRIQIPLRAFPLPLADKLHLSSHFSARSTVFFPFCAVKIYVNGHSHSHTQSPDTESGGAALYGFRRVRTRTLARCGYDDIKDAADKTKRQTRQSHQHGNNSLRRLWSVCQWGSEGVDRKGNAECCSGNNMLWFKTSFCRQALRGSWRLL